MWMFTKASGDFGPPFSGFPPTVLNVVVGVVIWHWFLMVEPAEARSEGLRDTIQDLAEFFYTYDGLVVSK